MTQIMVTTSKILQNPFHGVTKQLEKLNMHANKLANPPARSDSAVESDFASRDIASRDMDKFLTTFSIFANNDIGLPTEEEMRDAKKLIVSQYIGELLRERQQDIVRVREIDDSMRLALKMHAVTAFNSNIEFKRFSKTAMEKCADIWIEDHVRQRDQGKWQSPDEVNEDSIRSLARELGVENWEKAPPPPPGIHQFMRGVINTINAKRCDWDECGWKKQQEVDKFIRLALNAFGGATAEDYQLSGQALKDRLSELEIEEKIKEMIRNSDLELAKKTVHQAHQANKYKEETLVNWARSIAAAEIKQMIAKRDIPGAKALLNSEFLRRGDTSDMVKELQAMIEKSESAPAVRPADCPGCAHDHSRSAIMCVAVSAQVAKCLSDVGGLD